MNTVFVSPKHRMVGVDPLPAVRNLFPSAVEIDIKGGSLLAVPHGPAETVMLRNLGFDVPAPILHHYDWPGDRKPFEVQKKTCAMLTLNPRAYVLNGMGTGKTKAALWAWDYLYANGHSGKLLVVAPLSTLNFTWQAECFRTLPHRKAVVLHNSSRAKRLERLNQDADIYIINHDGVTLLQEDLVKRTDIDMLVVDELAVYRNGSAARTKHMREFAKTMKWVWGMTGSPIPHAPTDAWAQAQIVTPERAPRYFGRFRDDVCTKVSQFKYAPKRDAIDKVHKLMQPAVRFTLDEVVELPDIVERSIDIELGPQQVKAYRGLAAACYAMVQSQEITAANAGAAMSKLLQVALGWVYTSDRGVVALDNNKRIEALVDGIYSTDRKVLVFSPFKHCLEGIGAALDKEQIEYATVSGDTPAGERSLVFNLFQNTEKYKVLNAHPKCLAHGLTLTAADTIVWFGPTTDLETFDQANHRIRRVGQHHKQQLLLLQGTPIERKIYAMLQGKQKVQTALLTLFADATT